MTDSQRAIQHIVAEKMFLILGIDMGRKDTQYPLIPSDDRDRFLKEITEYFDSQLSSAVLNASIDELTSLQHHGSPTQSYVNYSDIEKRLNQLQESKMEYKTSTSCNESESKQEGK